MFHVCPLWEARDWARSICFEKTFSAEGTQLDVSGDPRNATGVVQQGENEIYVMRLLPPASPTKNMNKVK